MPTKKPPPPFLSPLSAFKAIYCANCADSLSGSCRIDDTLGLKRMEMCIRLLCNSPPDLAKFLLEARRVSKFIAETGLKTLTNIEETPTA